MAETHGGWGRFNTLVGGGEGSRKSFRTSHPRDCRSKSVPSDHESSGAHRHQDLSRRDLTFRHSPHPRFTGGRQDPYEPQIGPRSPRTRVVLTLPSRATGAYKGVWKGDRQGRRTPGHESITGVCRTVQGGSGGPWDDRGSGPRGVENLTRKGT